MSRVDMHPEELLDAARRRSLSAAERHRLDSHVEHCVACRVELAAMDDFHTEIAPRDGDADRARAIAVAALASAGLPGAGGRISRTETITRTVVRASRRRTAAIAGTALALGLFGGAAAAFFAGGGFRDDPPEPAPAPVPEAPPDVERHAAPAEPPLAASPQEEEDETTAVAPSAPEEEPPRVRRPVAPPTAEELLARGNEARRQGRYDQAERAYRTLQRLYPSSREAAVSHVTLGRLLLDGRGSPSAALDQFDRYLQQAGSGVLSEEARVGRALALGRLGRRDEERAAWRDLLAHHPDSLHAERARRALE